VLDRLIDTLLYEGYALYPYTPGSAKNAIPTPFGIVRPGAFLELQGELLREAEVRGEVHFLDGTGARHDLAPGEHHVAGLHILVALRQDGRHASLRVENRTPGPPDLQLALLSTHPVMYGPFRSPLDVVHHSVNTYPVLVEGGLLGAAIALPDFPRIAPESQGGLFDSTEIEEALLLHVQALTDSERASITDPRVREMIERAESVQPRDLARLHGRLTLSPPRPSAAVTDPRRGEPSAAIRGATVRPGDHVTLHPRPDADLAARVLEGRRATIERIYLDGEDTTYFAVTVDGDPGQDLMRETGRYLFFFAGEVEP